MTEPVVIYTSAWCGYCHRAKSLLQSKDVGFEEVRVDGNTELRMQMIERTGRQTVPQIFIGERHIGGCEELVGLELAGKLDELLSRDVAPA
jgi:glutaredoxin 3